MIYFIDDVAGDRLRPCYSIPLFIILRRNEFREASGLFCPEKRSGPGTIRAQKHGLAPVRPFAVEPDENRFHIPSSGTRGGAFRRGQRRLFTGPARARPRARRNRRRPRRGSKEDRRIPLALCASTSEVIPFFKLLLRPGDIVLVPKPGYPLFDHISRWKT